VSGCRSPRRHSAVPPRCREGRGLTASVLPTRAGSRPARWRIGRGGLPRRCRPGRGRRCRRPPVTSAQAEWIRSPTIRQLRAPQPRYQRFSGLHQRVCDHGHGDGRDPCCRHRIPSGPGDRGQPTGRAPGSHRAPPPPRPPLPPRLLRLVTRPRKTARPHERDGPIRVLTSDPSTVRCEGANRPVCAAPKTPGSWQTCRSASIRDGVSEGTQPRHPGPQLRFRPSALPLFGGASE
jgi:hypothetical protein